MVTTWMFLVVVLLAFSLNASGQTDPTKKEDDSTSPLLEILGHAPAKDSSESVDGSSSSSSSSESDEGVFKINYNVYKSIVHQHGFDRKPTTESPGETTTDSDDERFDEHDEIDEDAIKVFKQMLKNKRSLESYHPLPPPTRLYAPRPPPEQPPRDQDNL
ncbi:Hypothetical predicted protein [Cloeon dipterum]|nr:Hypothetical predicted protein [Cloeon dipterum]